MQDACLGLQLLDSKVHVLYPQGWNPRVLLGS